MRAKSFSEAATKGGHNGFLFAPYPGSRSRGLAWLLDLHGLGLDPQRIPAPTPTCRHTFHVLAARRRRKTGDQSTAPKPLNGCAGCCLHNPQQRKDMENIQHHIDRALRVDLMYRLAELHWKTWAAKLDFNFHPSAFSPSPGYLLIQKWAEAYGFPDDEAPLELARRLQIPLTADQRFLFAQRSSEYQLGAVDAFPFLQTLPPSPLDALGFRLRFFFPYSTADGKSISGGVAYLYDERHNGIMMPITPWVSSSGRLVWDYLAWQSLMPLFHLDVLFAHQERPSLILPSEYLVDKLSRNAAFLDRHFNLTTWPGGVKDTIAHTDWGLLRHHEAIIVVHPSYQGVHIAYSVYNELKKNGNDVSFILPTSQMDVSVPSIAINTLSYDINNAVIKNFYSSFNDFCLFAEQAFSCTFSEKPSQAISVQELLELPTQERPWVIENLIRSADRVMLYGEAKSGKTWIAFYMASEIAKKGHRVLYIDGEMSVSDLRQRVLHMVNHQEIQDNFRFISASYKKRSINLADEKEQERYSVELSNADVVILDNLQCLFSDALQSTPESNTQLNKFVNTLALKGKTVIMLHHSSRNGQPFGSSAKEFGLELVLRATRKNDTITIFVEKSRGLPSQNLKPLQYKISDEGAIEFLGEATSRSAKSLPPSSDATPDTCEEQVSILDQQILSIKKDNPKETVRGIADKLGKHRSTVSDHMQKLKNIGLLQ